MEVVENKLVSKPYKEYRKAEIHWLEQIPSHWQELEGMRFMFESKEKNDGMKRKVVLSISYGNIRVKIERELTGLVPESFETYQLVNKGDIIFRPTDLQNDKVSLRSAISNFEGIITSAYLNLRVKEVANNKYFHYVFRAIDNNKVIYGLGSGLRQNINFWDFKRFKFPFPPKTEQTSIANFLDDKTVKIDQTIIQKEKLIDLLKERKQIIIQNAVTKGLDPNVNLKDSGIEWIGEIPEHWEVKKMAYVAKIETGATPDRSKQNYWNGDIPWVKTSEVKYEIITTTEESITESGLNNSATRLSPKGTLLMAMYGQGITRGRVGLLGIPATYNQACCAMSFNEKIYNFYAYFFFVVAYSFIRDAGNETSQMNISAGYISTLKILMPPKEEQIGIVNYIEAEAKKYDKVISIEIKQIKKLKEYKATLIDSGVKGKIKVS